MVQNLSMYDAMRQTVRPRPIPRPPLLAEGRKRENSMERKAVERKERDWPLTMRAEKTVPGTLLTLSYRCTE